VQRETRKEIEVYKRILLAYDGSVEGRTALREGALVAKRCGAKVFLLSVVAETAGTRIAQGAEPRCIIQQQESYKAVLTDGVTRLKRLGFEPVAKLVIGEPAQQIGAYADQIAADLVVVGYRRQSALARWWSGPSGAHLVDHIHCSLLIGRNVISHEDFEAELRKFAGTAAPQDVDTE
jgi:nucleotide-binding universal stress UspA family protein